MSQFQLSIIIAIVFAAIVGVLAGFVWFINWLATDHPKIGIPVLILVGILFFWSLGYFILIELGL